MSDVTRMLATAPRATARKSATVNREAWTMTPGWIPRLAGRDVLPPDPPERGMYDSRDEAVEAARRVREHAQSLLESDHAD